MYLCCLLTALLPVRKKPWMHVQISRIHGLMYTRFISDTCLWPPHRQTGVRCIDLGDIATRLMVSRHVANTGHRVLYEGLGFRRQQNQLCRRVFD